MAEPANPNCVRPPNVPRSLTAILESKRVDQSRQSGGLLATARIVEKEARKRRAPVLQHAHQRSARKMFGDAVLRDPRKPGSVKSRLNHQIEFVQEQ